MVHETPGYTHLGDLHKELCNFFVVSENSVLKRNLLSPIIDPVEMASSPEVISISSQVSAREDQERKKKDEHVRT